MVVDNRDRFPCPYELKNLPINNFLTKTVVNGDWFAYLATHTMIHQLVVALVTCSHEPWSSCSAAQAGSHFGPGLPKWCFQSKNILLACNVLLSCSPGYSERIVFP